MASPTLMFLLHRLEDEFRDRSEVRIRGVFKSSTQKSIDLEQDYDPESSNIHRVSGVQVFTGRKEFFFTEDLGLVSNATHLSREISRVWEALGVLTV